jgi:hypothetical protein
MTKEIAQGLSNHTGIIKATGSNQKIISNEKDIPSNLAIAQGKVTVWK